MGSIVEDFENGWPDALVYGPFLEQEYWDSIYLSKAYAISGSHSLAFDDSFSVAIFALYRPAILREGQQVDHVEWWFREPESNANGSAIALRDAAGQYICAFGTSNPDWEVVDADGWERHPGNDGQYDTWTRVRFTFDWSAGTFDVTAERSGGEPQTFSDRPIGGDSVAELAFVGFQGKGNGIGSSDKTRVWYDRIEIAGAFETFQLSGEVLDEQTGGPLETKVRAYRWDNGAYGADAMSDPADGSFTITGLVADVPYMVVSVPPEGYRPRAHGPIEPIRE